MGIDSADVTMTARQPRDAETTLAAWRARDAQVRERTAAGGLVRSEEFVAKSGLDILQAMMRGEAALPPINKTLDFIFVEVDPGRVQFQGRPQFEHYNPLGSVHGGWIATLLDSAMACAVHSLLPAGRTYTTLELKVNFVRALTHEVPLVRAIGEVIHGGRRIGTAQGRLVGPDGTLYAHATTTCLVLDAR